MKFDEQEIKEINQFWKNYYISNCELCHGSGLREGKLCSCTKACNAAVQCEINGFGRLHLTKSLNDGNLKNNINDYFMKFNINKKIGRGLYIFGKYSTGKTLATAILAKNILMIENPLGTNIFNIKFFLYDDLVRFSYDEHSFSTLETIIKRTNILVLDNIGNETGLHTSARSSVSLLDNIIRNREMNGKITWLTTQNSPEQFAQNYSEPLRQIIRRNYQIIHT